MSSGEKSMFQWRRQRADQIACQQANQALSARFAAIREAMAMIVFTPQGVVIDANNKFLQLMEYRLEEVQGEHHRIFCAPALVASRDYQQLWQRLARGESVTDKFLRQNKSGRAVWLEASYMPVREADGRVSQVIKLAADITAAVERAQQQNALVTAINRSMAVIAFNPQGEVLTANENFEHAMGYRLAEIRGQHHRLFCSPELTASSEYHAFWAQLNRGEFISGLFERRTRHGDVIWLRATYNPIFDESGKLYQIVKFATDVTPQVRKNQLESEAARQAYVSALQTSDSTRHGREVVNDSAQMMLSIAAQLQQATADITALNQQSDRISSIVGTIRGIAEQTNLLALNAAIEAARAGEAGRGFAVVADEVRKLAEKTMTATQDVGRAVCEIQEGTRKNISSVETVVAAVEKAASLSTHSGESLKNILEFVDQVNDQVQSIATASEQQSATSEEINRSVEQIATISAETAQAMEHAAKSVTDLIQQTHVLHALIQDMKKQSQAV